MQMADPDEPRDQQSETVGPPHRDDDPPTRGKASVVWVAVALVLVFALAIALVVAAVGAA
jgi:hypothetical protein